MTETREQSPVDIPADAPVHPDDTTWRYRLAPISVDSDGYAIRIDPGPTQGGGITIGSTDYELQQFHFHSPAEHTFAGARAAMEVHFVHTDADGALCAVGVLIVVGEHHPALERILARTDSLDPTQLLPIDRSYVTYHGSLTTPPHTEGVTWRLLMKPIELSVPQLAAFQAWHHDNARPIQPLDGRTFG